MSISLKSFTIIDGNSEKAEIKEMELLFLITIAISAFILVRIHNDREYRKTSYHQITKHSYSSIRYDKGKYGEYLIYKCLKHLENNNAKFLFNIYLPKTNYETTEIDVLLICAKGLFAFESKNYSGWIFGHENQTNWTQSLPRGRGYSSHKERFYNPVKQNAAHIKHLQRIFDRKLPIQSVIVFSDKCTLKDVTVKTDGINVINCRYVSRLVGHICSQITNDLLTKDEINNIYHKLYPYTQVTDEIKKRHTEAFERLKTIY